jgi:DNA-binding transcriptional regulator LsrR (DeoR family)
MKKSDLVKIARLYYEKKMTQQKIADIMNISRMAVSRSLSKCEEEGIVEIKISTLDSYMDMEDAIKRSYPLAEVHIVPFDDEINVLQRLLSEKAMDVLSRHLKKGANVGVGWGSTMRALKNYARDNEMPHIEAQFVPLMGGYGNADSEFHASQIAATLGKAYNGGFLQLHAPAIVGSSEIKKVLIEDAQIDLVFKSLKKLDLAIHSFGCLSAEDASVLSSGYFTESDINELRRAQVECDIVSSIYLDRDGNEVDLEILTRTIGISSEDYKKIPIKIAVAGGDSKLPATKLVARSGLVDILVTDEKTGEHLVNNAK